MGRNGEAEGALGDDVKSLRCRLRLRKEREKSKKRAGENMKEREGERHRGHVSPIIYARMIKGRNGED